MMTSTTNEIFGHRVVRHIGVVRGITVRSRNLVSDAIGGVQSMLGGRVGVDVRRSDPVAGHVRLVDHAARVGDGQAARVDREHQPALGQHDRAVVLCHGPGGCRDVDDEGVGGHNRR